MDQKTTPAQVANNEKILDNIAKEEMKDWNLGEFKKTHPTLYWVIILAMEKRAKQIRAINSNTQNSYRDWTQEEINKEFKTQTMTQEELAQITQEIEFVKARLDMLFGKMDKVMTDMDYYDWGIEQDMIGAKERLEAATNHFKNIVT